MGTRAYSDSAAISSSANATTGDENGPTSLGGVDLYPDPLAAAVRIRNIAQHPFEFCQKLGFRIVGVLPDANGFGKPDIFMAKRVRQ
jgi:aminoglycoside 6'-N-acetyltransferase I